MGLDDFCNTTLVLGLGLMNDDQKKINKPSLKAGGGFEPCLSLGLSEGPYDDSKGGSDHRPLCPQESVTSSSLQTGVVVKREREVVGSEEVETERVSSRMSDEDDDGNNIITKKLRLNKDQSVVLEESFKLNSTLNPKQKQELARKLNLRARQVEVWFQNRRARTKVKQTEVDCEFLKKCCETLTEENKRLQKELHELKAVKLTRPLHLHMPASTLTMCPSCETISGNADSIIKIPKNSLITGSPKGHFLINPFGKSSAAC